MGSLVEREELLAQLHGLWTQVQQTARGRVVLVRGEAGSGKTALLRAFSDGLAVPVTWGGCHPLSTPRPLGPFAEIADQLRGDLAALVDEGRPHAIAAALVGQVPAQGSAVLVLEDLHWADDASLDVVRMLARPIRDHALLVLASYRDDEVERVSGLRTALGDLCGPETTRLEVPLLSPAAVKALCRGTHLDPRELHRVTGGNAFYVTEALAAPDEEIPGTVVDAALSRLARLGPAARSVAEAVAIVPQRCELWLVDSLAGLENLDAAVASGVLVSDGDGVAFRHELARRAVEGTLPPYRAMQLHRTALHALVARGAEPSRLAHHADAGHDSPAVLVHARAAAERATRLGSKRQAAAHWEQALRHAPANEPLVRAELLERLSFAAYLVDRMTEAVAALEEALALQREYGEPVGQGRVLLSLGRRVSCAGRESETPLFLAQAQEVLEALPPSRELAEVYAGWAYTCFEESDVTGTHAWGRRAVELGRELGAVDVVAHALNTMGTCELFRGRDPQLLLDSLELARRHDLDEAVGRALLHLSSAFAEQRRLDQLDLVEDGVVECDLRGLELWRRYLMVNRAELHLLLGRWDDAAEGVAEIIASPLSAPLPRLGALCVTARVRLRRGDPGGREALAEARALAAGHPGLCWQRPVALVEAELAWLDDAPVADVLARTDAVLAESWRFEEQWGVDELVRWRRVCGAPPEPTSGSTLYAEPSPDAWRQLGCGFEAALALLEQGDAVEALALLQLVGAHGAAARVAKQLRQQGVRELPRGPRPRTRANPAQLTDREVDVLRLVAVGLSNSAIADQLVLATKTVDKHVSAALRKLAVPSRTEAAARAHQLGLVPG